MGKTPPVRIAVLLYGQPRFLKRTARSINEEFEIDGCNTDFFYHSWPSVGYSISDEQHKTNDLLDKKLLESKFSELYSPAAGYVSEDYSELEQILNNLCGITSFLSKDFKIPEVLLEEHIYYTGQFYSLGEVVKKKKEYEKQNNFKYDVVIRVRTDTFFKGIEFYSNEERYQNEKFNFYVRPVLKNPRTVFSGGISYLQGRPSVLHWQEPENCELAIQAQKVEYVGGQFHIDGHNAIGEGKPVRITAKRFDRFRKLFVTASNTLFTDSDSSNLCWKNMLGIYLSLYFRNLHGIISNIDIELPCRHGEIVEGQAITNNNLSARSTEGRWGGRCWKVTNDRTSNFWKKQCSDGRLAIKCGSHEDMIQQIKEAGTLIQT